MTHRKPLACTFLLAALWTLGCAPDDGGSGVVAHDSALARAAAEDLVGLAHLSPVAVTVAHRIEQPALAAASTVVDLETCDQVEQVLWNTCTRLGSDVQSACYPYSTFFFAHDVPRCGVRVSLTDTNPQASMESLFVFDLSGTPSATPDHCGDGELDEGEECDDGNHEAFDGCDPTCHDEGFVGCEAIIEDQFRAADIAIVDQNLWQGPRSQLMVHPAPQPLRPVDDRLCAQAAATGDDVCREIVATMPFAAYCGPQVDYLADTHHCAVRLQIGFQSLDPASGVFTTALSGVLTFTL